jgi:hypothetical protein
MSNDGYATPPIRSARSRSRTPVKSKNVRSSAVGPADPNINGDLETARLLSLLDAGCDTNVARDALTKIDLESAMKKVADVRQTLSSHRLSFSLQEMGNRVRDFEGNACTMRVRQAAGGIANIIGALPSKFHMRDFLQRNFELEDFRIGCHVHREHREEIGKMVWQQLKYTYTMHAAMLDFWTVVSYLQGEYGELELIIRICHLLEGRAILGYWSHPPHRLCPFKLCAGSSSQSICDQIITKHLADANGISRFWDLVLRSSQEVCSHCGPGTACTSILGSLLEISGDVANRILSSGMLSFMLGLVANFISYSVEIEARQARLPLGNCRLLYNNKPQLPVLACIDGISRGRVLVFANEARRECDPFDSFINEWHSAPQTAVNIRIMVKNAGIEIDNLPIINHKRFHDKFKDVPPTAAAFQRSIWAMIAALRSTGRLVIWCGKFHSQLFDALFPSAQVYQGHLQILPTLPAELDTMQVASMALHRWNHYGPEEFKAILTGGSVHVAFRGHPAYKDTLLNLWHELPAIVSQAKQNGVDLS